MEKTYILEIRRRNLLMTVHLIPGLLPICGTVSMFGSIRQKEASALSQGNAGLFREEKR